jgi:flagellar protein FliO/FliZ
METIFGAGMPIAAKAILALIIVIGLASAVFYVVRQVSTSRIGSAAIRGRQPRLAVIEVAGIDPRRRLLLIRRDNVEHLIMIGGPTDVVVEPNIVRAVAVTGTRDAAPARSQAGPEPRALPDGTARAPQAAESTMWPLQAEPAGRPQRPAKAEDPAWAPQADPATRVSSAVDHLAGLAAELGRAPAPQDGTRAPSVAPADSAPAAKREPKRGPAPTAAAQPAATANDQNLTEMAQRLEAALRHSPGTAGPRPAEAGARPAPELSVIGSRSSPTGAGPAEPPRTAADPRARNDGKAAGQTKAVYDNLEQEMASLLGRPAGKT